MRVLQGVELARRRAGSAARGRARDHGRGALVAGVAIASPTIVAKADNTGRVQGGIEHEAYLWHDLKGLIDANGGKDALLACGGVFSGPFQTQMVAYELGIHGIQVGWKVTPPPGVAFRTRTVPDGPLVTKPTDDRYRLVRPARQVAAAHGAADGHDPRRLPRGRAERADRAAGRRRGPGPAQGRGDRQRDAATVTVRGALTRIAGWQASPPVHEPCRGVGSLPNSCVLPALVLLGLLARVRVPAHELARRVAVDGRGAVDRDRLAAAASTSPARAAGGRLAAALLHAALGLDGRCSATARPRRRACRWSIALLADPGRAVGRLEPVRPPRRALICAALCAVNPFLTALRAGDAHVLAHAASCRCSPRRPSCTCSPSAAGGTCRCSSVLLARDALHAQLGALPRRAGSRSALIPCWYVSEDRRELLARRADRLRRRRPALPALGAHAAPPGPAHRRALAQPAELRRARSRSPGRCSAAARPRSRCVLAGGSGLAAVLARRVDDKERTARARRRCHRARPRSRSPGSCRRSRPPGRRATSACCSARCCCSPRSGSPAPATLGLVALVIILGIWAIPKTLRAREQVERRRPAQRRRAASCTRATS